MRFGFPVVSPIFTEFKGDRWRSSGQSMYSDDTRGEHHRFDDHRAGIDPPGAGKNSDLGEAVT